ncbi:hemolysin family protein [Algibacillus agarilyticus]|uniref:hemolysin family protein n=1 Tax=Algibacillus agarilyticus TaxID=2234133 RepID=UPI000DD0D575|nr:hemolysin family protein [Algibacillus agarilyticus]
MNNDFFWIFVLIVASAFFAIAEIALAAARKLKLSVLADEGHDNAKLVLQLQAKSGAFFAVIQIALNAIAILGGIIGEAAFNPLIQEGISYFYQGRFLAEISFTCSFLLVTSLFILFADLIPKRIGMSLPEPIAMRVVKPMMFCVILLKPFVVFFNSISDAILRLCRIPTERVDNVTAQDIVAIVDAGAASGSIQSQEYQMIGNVFELESRSLMSVMSLRDDIVFFNTNESSESLSQKIIEHPHNFYLVCENSLDHIVGLVESKALLKQVLAGHDAEITADMIDTQVMYLPDSLSLSEALEAFKYHTESFAVVLNEYSLVVGVVTLKDLITVVVDGFSGSIDEEQIRSRDANSWLIDGAASIIDVARALDIDGFPEPENYETLAGFIMYKLRKLPTLTDHVIYAEHRFEVIDMDKLKISKLLVTKVV